MVGVSLVALAPHAIQAWRKDASGWDRQLSEAIHAYENEHTVLDEYGDPFRLVLHPLAQALEILLVLGIAVFLVLRRPAARRLAYLLLLAVAGAVVLSPLLKEVFERPPIDPSPRRSDDSRGLPGANYSFPSGHAFRSIVAFAAVVLAAWATRWRWHAVTAGVVVTSLTGVGVVYHEWHWASDVVGGWCFGIAWVALLWLALRPVGGDAFERSTSA